MGECDCCSGDNGISFTCNECGGTFCSRHRLPEDHNCTGLKANSGGRTVGSTNHTTDRDVQSTDSGAFRERRAWYYRHPFLVALLATVVFIGALASAAPADVLQGGNSPAGAAVNDSTTTSTLTPTPSTAAPSTTTSTSEALDVDRVEVLVHQYINEERSERSLSTLFHDEHLRRIASKYSEEMATEGFFAHTSPSGADFQDRYELYGYECRVSTDDGQYAIGGENIQYTYAFAEVSRNGSTVVYDSEKDIAEAIVYNWMQSQDHRKNLLKSHWENEGIGVYTIQNPDGPGVKVYATQNFC